MVLIDALSGVLIAAGRRLASKSSKTEGKKESIKITYAFSRHEQLTLPVQDMSARVQDTAKRTVTSFVVKDAVSINAVCLRPRGT